MDRAGLMTKSELRKLFLDKRRELTASERARLSENISDNFFQNFDLRQISVVHCFISIKKFYEIDTSPIFLRFWQDFPQVIAAVPRVDHKSGELESIAYLPGTELVSGRWEIPEPTHDEFVEPSVIDLVIVPLVCFDLHGHRVGYGKGFYDRFLNRCRPDCIKVGLTYFPPADTIENPTAHDVTLDYCVSPDRLFVLNSD
jgi:5-formyltetrahydrofolate cyclo-ligase